MSESPCPSHDFNTAYTETDLGVATGVFTRRHAADGQSVLVEGVCPRCHGNTASEYRHGLPGTGTKGLDLLRRNRRPAPQDDDTALLREVHFCECGHPHPGLPADAPWVGCGAGWRVAALTPADEA
ncbi:hypothetical protein [Streptomyces sp. DH24]|uniref:hypothetical protein n=1 Tax=Streptomyces sp. DH24 TaxID=3040123 RepID=UPI002442012A|nr:hypothetical protein [Streptomyces sp. DH24]MDG9718267.1 hypothetical protein [Streptomyces sp. DH24]